MSRLPAIDPEHPDQAELIIRRLSQYADLASDEIALLRGLAEGPERLSAGTELIAEGELLDSPKLLVAGWACRQRFLSDGRRQIFDFILPGDIFGLHLRPQAVALCSAITLTRATISNAPALGEAILSHPDSYSGLTTACLMSASSEEAYLLNQLVRVGRQTAYERVAHLILELHHRLSVIGLANEGYLPLPLTQEIIADALGLSIVHLNRTLQQLRRAAVRSRKIAQHRRFPHAPRLRKTGGRWRHAPARRGSLEFQINTAIGNRAKSVAQLKKLSPIRFSRAKRAGMLKITRNLCNSENCSPAPGAAISALPMARRRLSGVFAPLNAQRAHSTDCGGNRPPRRRTVAAAAKRHRS